MGFSLDLYKSKADNSTLNHTIFNILAVLEKNGDRYIDELPLTIEPFTYTIEGQKLARFKKDFKLDEDASAEEAFYQLKEKYGITNESIIETRKIMTIRYSITNKGYSSTKAIRLCR